jgi:hypothetical protein
MTNPKWPAMLQRNRLGGGVTAPTVSAEITGGHAAYTPGLRRAICHYVLVGNRRLRHLLKKASVKMVGSILRQEVDSVCRDLGKLYDKESDRDYAFELWVANLLIAECELDIDPGTCTYISKRFKDRCGV